MSTINWEKVHELSREQLVAILEDYFTLQDYFETGKGENPALTNVEYETWIAPAEGTQAYSDLMDWLRAHFEQLPPDKLQPATRFMREHPKLIDWPAFLEENVGTNELASYLKAPFGYKIGLYANGQVVVGQDVGNEISEDERPVGMVAVPGIGNLDSTEYSAGYAVYGEDGLYRRIKDNLVIGDFEALIDDTCENGEVQEWLDELRSNLVPESTPRKYRNSRME